MPYRMKQVILDYDNHCYESQRQRFIPIAPLYRLGAG